MLGALFHVHVEVGVHVGVHIEGKDQAELRRAEGVGRARLVLPAWRRG